MKQTPHATILFLICLSVVIASASGCSPPAPDAQPTSRQRGDTAHGDDTPRTGDTADLPADLEDLEAALTAETVDDRPGVLEYLGPPDAFDISFIEVDGVEVRMESWRYYQFLTRVDFVDGEAVWTVEIESVPDGTFFAAWYDPLAFRGGMTGDEVAQAIAGASPAGMEPQRIDLSEGGEDLAGGTVLVGDQITVGLYEDRLAYVETVAMMPEGGEQ